MRQLNLQLARLAMRVGWWGPVGRIPRTPLGADDLGSLLESEWADYGVWLRPRTVGDVAVWQALRSEALNWWRPPRISLVTPTYNTDPEHLRQYLLSVRNQSYPFWQLCVVDDCSSQADVWPTLQKAADGDPRISIGRLARNGGTCLASNAAIAMATGEFVAFLDHDDVLATDALHRVAEAIRADPMADVLYSDRDMLSSNGRRFRHLLKPAWSPETLLSGNYVFHLTAYRRTLLRRLGGLRSAYEGSQDYDLILRASEVTDRIRHIPRVLYHWREHPASIATNVAAKRYVYDAGKAALTDAMRRRGFDVSVSDVEGFRGHYRPHLPAPDPRRVAVLRMEAADGVGTYAHWLRHAVDQISPGADFVVVLGPGVMPVGAAAVDALVQWLQIPGVGFVTGRVVTADGRLAHAGLVLRPGGVPLALYQGFPSAEPGYMAYTAVLRNVSAPHPLCLAFRREVWDALGGLAPEFVGSHGILDMALRARVARWRTVYVPYAEFVAAEEVRVVAPWLAGEADAFALAWRSWLERGDPCYPIGMSLERADMALADDATPPPILR